LLACVALPSLFSHLRSNHSDGEPLNDPQKRDRTTISVWPSIEWTPCGAIDRFWQQIDDLNCLDLTPSPSKGTSTLVENQSVVPELKPDAVRPPMARLPDSGIVVSQVGMVV
jgi:hypothetical protein